MGFSCVIRDQKGEVDFGFLDGGEIPTGFFSGFFEALHGHRFAAQVEFVGFGETKDQPFDYALIEVLVIKEGIASRRDYFKHTVFELKDRDIEGSTA